MSLTISISEQRVQALIEEVLESLPECSLSFWCRVLDRKAMRFRFSDNETGQRCEVAYPEWREGMRRYSEWLTEKGRDFQLNSVHWDAPMIDNLVQFTLFGDIRY
jgi:hypothetical protein